MLDGLSSPLRPFQSLIERTRHGIEWLSDRSSPPRSAAGPARFLEHEGLRSPEQPASQRQSRRRRLPFASISSPSDPPSTGTNRDKPRAWMFPGRSRTASDAAEAPATSAPPPQEKEYYITKVEVSGADGDDLRAAQQAVWLKANSMITKSELLAVRDDLVNVGLFGWVEPVVEPYRDGTAVEFKVKPNAPFRGASVTGASKLPKGFADEVFEPLHGRTANLSKYLEAQQRINQWYEHNDIFAVVDDDPDRIARSMASGQFEIQVNELGVRCVETRFVDDKGEGKKARTQPHRIQRYISLRPGDVLDINRVQDDIRALSSLGIFEGLSGRPLMSEAATAGEDGTSAGRSGSVVVETLKTPDGVGGAPYIHRQGLQQGDLIDWEYLLTEKKKFGEFSCQGGAMMEAGHGFQPIGQLSYTNNNVAGTLRRLSAQLKLHHWHDRCIDVSWTDPWLASSSRQRRLSQTANVHSNRAYEDAIFGVVQEADAGPVRRGGDDDGDRRRQSVTVERSGLTLERSAWLTPRCFGTVGAALDRSRCVDGQNETLFVDPYQWPLTHSSSGIDKALSGFASVFRTGRSTSARATLTQAVCPPGWSRNRGPWLAFTRLKGHAVAETRGFKSTTARLAASGGLQLGDLPPYDAHALGGVNCVRGYDEGAMGTARHWAMVSVEVESPTFWDRFSGVAFLDAGSDLNSGQTVVGDPAGTRGKPGKGCGYGFGLRMASPMGPLRAEYGWCDRSKWREEGRGTLARGRLHIGIGPRF